ncbi:hypothetical protein GGD56_000307 [Rhizobium mongolense]|uniref:Uncharacterized protein n=1 Tax=Rhizobium mongolense TaxID=57676 RepID=A0ABR6IF44_9HYPH|nr:hypothetical protein [Rhizobium mongolense]
MATDFATVRAQEIDGPAAENWLSRSVRKPQRPCLHPRVQQSFRGRGLPFHRSFTIPVHTASRSSRHGPPGVVCSPMAMTAKARTIPATPSRICSSIWRVILRSRKSRSWRDGQLKENQSSQLSTMRYAQSRASGGIAVEGIRKNMTRA